MLAVGAALLLVAGALAPPFLEEGARHLVRQAFAPVCHQMPGRSFAIGGVPLAVGHRCFGIYAGVLAGTLAWPLLSAPFQQKVGRRAGGLLVIAGVPAALDWGLGLVDWWANTTLTQTATGALLGVALGLLLARGAGQLWAPDTAVAARQEPS